MNKLKDMCDMNAGYNDVKELVMNVMGLSDWLQDKEPVEPDFKNVNCNINISLNIALIFDQ